MAKKNYSFFGGTRDQIEHISGGIVWSGIFSQIRHPGCYLPLTIIGQKYCDKTLLQRYHIIIL